MVKVIGQKFRVTGGKNSQEENNLLPMHAADEIETDAQWARN